ncbi:MAG: hypothetical protein J6Z82_05980 [Schwartzia sp.]|nr:hypothetical protein [Schwartzia sp. (in: firmicutes)]
MAPNVQAKLEEIIKGNIKFFSPNLALNMLISRLQRKWEADPDSMPSCIKEMDDFMTRYATVLSDEFDKIASL